MHWSVSAQCNFKSLPIGDSKAFVQLRHDKIMWKSWIFTFGFMVFVLKVTSSPNMLRERFDLYCLWKPFQQNCGLFFLFQICWHHQENEKKSHLSSVQQKQHILTSHSESKMLFREKGQKAPSMVRYSDMKDEVCKMTSWYVYNNIIPAPQSSWTDSNKQSLFTLLSKKAVFKMDVHVSWKEYVFRELRFAFDCGANLISSPPLHFQAISKSSALKAGSWASVEPICQSLSSLVKLKTTLHWSSVLLWVSQISNILFDLQMWV